jgi:hypothetical protein
MRSPGGRAWRAPAWEGPFTKGPSLVHFDPKGGVGEGFCHGEVHRSDEVLHLFYTRMGDRPELIFHAIVDLGGDWMRWQASTQVTLLAPDLPWEGAALALERSVMGGLEHRVRELRDPCVFIDDDGAAYLLYCGAGESGIGIAKLSGL